VKCRRKVLSSFSEFKINLSIAPFAVSLKLNPEDAGSTFHRDVDELLQDYPIPIAFITISVGTSNPTKFFSHRSDILLSSGK
jgi:hypothetical protein